MGVEQLERRREVRVDGASDVLRNSDILRHGILKDLFPKHELDARNEFVVVCPAVECLVCSLGPLCFLKQLRSVSWTRAVVRASPWGGIVDGSVGRKVSGDDQDGRAGVFGHGECFFLDSEGCRESKDSGAADVNR